MNPRNSVFSSAVDLRGASEVAKGIASAKMYLLRGCISITSLLLLTALFVVGRTQDSAHAQIVVTPVATPVVPGTGDPFDPTIPVNLLGATITVNSQDDLPDTNVGDGFCDGNDLAFGEQCTLRAAIEEANFMSGRLTPHRIEFEFTGTGPFALNLGAQLPSINVPVNINGTTQAGTTCPTRNAFADLQVVIDGGGTAGNGLIFSETAGGSTLQGVAIGGFPGISVRLFGDNNLVTCNHIGVDASGTVAMGSAGTGVEISGVGNLIGGDSDHSSRNVISGHGLEGVLIWGDDNQVQNNFIGTTADGLNALGNVGGGIEIKGNGNEIGGTSRLARNVISGNGSNDNSAFGGISIASADENVIAGNSVGLARDGSTALPNVGNGVEAIGGSVDNIIGPAGGGNVIAFNEGHGVFIENRSSLSLQNTIRGNSIYSNDELGIELAGNLPATMSGPDINDTDDVDVGPNNHQNYPALLAAVSGGSVDGRLHSMANTDYIVELFHNDACDLLGPDQGHGEGQFLLDAVLVQTNNSGSVHFSITHGAPVGSFITATATDPDGNTSEFSACVEVTASVASSPTAADTAVRLEAADNDQLPAKDAVVRATPSTAVIPLDQTEGENEPSLFLPLVASD